MSDKEEVKGEVVVLDYGDFRNKKFVNCKIVYRGGRPPILLDNHFLECEWIFEGPALNTVNFLHGLAASGGSSQEFVIKGMLGIER